MIELRSDTFTLPTPDMLAASVDSPLGDDVWGEDPTVAALETKAALLMGKQAGLFVTSGTQGNLLAMLTHTRRGDEVIVGHKSHIFNAEVAGSAVVGGIQLRVVRNTERGTLELNELESAIRSQDVHYPVTSLICIENTHNHCGGAVLDLGDMAAVRTIAMGAGIAVHLDGARIFNAAVALRVEAREIADFVDSVSFCLSKGLSAPVGSVLCGSEAFIKQARRYRKMLGGGMRQAGVIAGPGIVALDSMVTRLADDHLNATVLGRGINELRGIRVNLETLQTNIVIADVSETGRDASEIVANLAQRGVLAAPVGNHEIRFVTHRGVTPEEVDHAIEVVGLVVANTEAALQI